MLHARVLVPCLILFGGLLAGCQGDPFTGAQDKAEDQAARVEYFETAAVTYYDGGRYDLAEIQFRRVLEQDATNKKAKRGLAKSLYMQASTPQFNRQQKAVKLREAQRLLEEVLPLDWPNPAGGGSRRYEVKTDLALVYADLADLYDRDVRDLQHSLKNDATGTDSEYTGTIAVQVSKRDALLHKAIPLFKEVMAENKNNPYSMAGLAKAHLQLGEEDEGIHWARRYMDLSRSSQHGWKEELESYSESVRGQVPAQQRQVYLDKIQGARDKEKKMHLMLASVYMRRGEFGEAVAEYNEVIQLDSTVPAAYLERAQAFAMLLQFDRAVSDLEEYLKITDPQIHRQQRLSAVELLDRYQSALARGDAAPLGNRPAARPADAWGSPDGR